MKELIQKLFTEAGQPLEDEQAQKLAVYMEGILEYNEHVNLTSITDPEALSGFGFYCSPARVPGCRIDY